MASMNTESAFHYERRVHLKLMVNKVIDSILMLSALYLFWDSATWYIED